MNELREFAENPLGRQLIVAGLAGILGLADGVRERFDKSGRSPSLTESIYLSIPFSAGIIKSFIIRNPVAGDYGVEISSNVASTGIGYFMGKGLVKKTFKTYDSVRKR